MIILSTVDCMLALFLLRRATFKRAEHHPCSIRLKVTFKLAFQIARTVRGHFIDPLMVQFDLCI